MTPLPCIVCGRELEDASGDENYNQPYAGTAFRSRGHYGSTVWDTMADRWVWLEINVCDPCMEAKAAEEKIRVVREVPQRPEYTARPWRGKGDEG